jgi:hypothetical protein
VLLNSVRVVVRHARLLKLIEEPRQGIRELSEALMEVEVRTPLVAPTDPKVSTTPSSNRFAITLDASDFGITANLSDGLKRFACSTKLQIGRHADVPRKRECPS